MGAPEKHQARFGALQHVRHLRLVEIFGRAGKPQYAGGGGAHNDWLMQRLAASFPRAEVHSADKLNIAADAIEAVAFAWFAKQRIALEPIRLTTGSGKPRLLGAVYEPSP